MDVMEAAGILLAFGVSALALDKIVRPRRREAVSKTTRRIVESPTMIRMWCDECKRVIARSGTGKDHGHRNARCRRGNMWELPAAAEIPSLEAAEATADDLADASDRELHDWLIKHVGTSDLSPEDLEMFRQSLGQIHEATAVLDKYRDLHW